MEELKQEQPLSFDAIGIQWCQQNRYPLLFIDKAPEVVPGKYAKAVKNFTYNEWFFPAHFEDEPNVPGFVQLEALAQTFLMTFLSIDEFRGEKAVNVNIDNVMFKRKIVPGDTMEIHATLNSFRRGIAKGSVKSYVSGEAAASADFVTAIPAVLSRMKPGTRG